MEKEKDHKSILQKIRKVVLGEDIELAEMALEDGSVLFAEKFEAGESVFILEGEERIPLPVGEYTMSDGMKLIVTTEGVIESMAAAEAAPPAEEDEGLSEADLKAIEKLKEENENLKKEKEQLAAEKKEVEAKLSKPAAKPIKASPEGKGDLKMKEETNRRALVNMSPSERIHVAMAKTPAWNNVKLSTTQSITTTYAGEFAGDYIAAATLQGVTLGANAITIKPNVKKSIAVKKTAISDTLADATCDFSATGTVALTEAILTPKELQVNLELCKTDFADDWEAIQMGYSAFDQMPPNFQSFFLMKMAEITNASIETSIWHGVAATAGQFGGFVPLMTADATVIDEAGTTVTAANVIAEIGTVVDKIPTTIYSEPDLTIYVAPNIYRAYIRALGGFAAAGVGGSGTNAQGTQWYNSGQGLSFDGIRVFMANGLSSNYMVAAQASNLWYGTGLLNDANEIKILDMSDIDGSKNLRYIMRFSAGVQYGYGSEIVLYTPA